MSFRDTTKQNMNRRTDRNMMLERLSSNLVGENKSIAIEIKELKDSGKSCSICANFFPQWVKCKLGRKIITQFNICTKFKEEEK